MTEYRSLQWVPVRRDRSELEPRLSLVRTVSRGCGKFPVLVTKVRAFQGSKIAPLERSYVHTCMCVHVHSHRHEVSKALPCCAVT